MRQPMPRYLRMRSGGGKMVRPAGGRAYPVACNVQIGTKMRRTVGCRQGAMTGRDDWRSPCLSGGYHARKSNAADSEKDQQIGLDLDVTGH